MIRRRFPLSRVVRIISSTVIASAWVTTLIARAGAVDEPVDVAMATTGDGSTGDVAVTEASTGMPVLPEDGLVVIRLAARPEPEVVVRRVVVERPSSAPGARSRARSSGS